MQLTENFKFLNCQKYEKKSTEKNKNLSYLILNLLDSENNPCKFFVFDEKIRDFILATGFSGLQDLLVTISLKYSSDAWRVSIVDIKAKEKVKY